jgi:NADH-quinone oxidoreductase subunit G
VSANGVRHLPVAETMNEVRTSLKKYSPQEIALVVTGQHTTEEITALVKYFTQDLKSSEVYYWINNPETFDNFDGLLFRGDRNPNSKGALRVLAENKAENPWANLSSGVAEGKIKAVVVLGPENISVFPDFEQRVAELSRAEVLVWGTACVHPALNKTTNKTILVPLRTYVEKSGTFVNYQGKEQKVSPVRVVVDAAVTGEEFAQLLKEGSLPEQRIVSSPVEQVRNEFLHIRGEL